jgi:DNA-binding MurR/RpiR family transcriptional regulator
MPRSSAQPLRYGPIADRIAALYPQLTGAQRAIADFVVGEPLEVARMSIHAMVRVVGVSVASANRFARALGYAGYAAFRSDLIRGFETVFEPSRRLRVQLEAGSDDHEVFASSLEEDMTNIRRTMQSLDPEKCKGAVDAILSAKRLFILGFDKAAHLGALLASGLSLARDEVYSVSNAEGGFGAARRLFQSGPSDLVIAIAFPNYYRETLELTRFAQSQGVEILAITDRPQSPLAPLAKIVLYCHSERRFGSSSDASALALLEALKAAVMLRSTGAVENAERFAAFAFPWVDPH